MTFNDMIGEIVLAVVPTIHPVEFQELKVHGAEAGGIWVECQHLTDMALKSIGLPVAKRTPIWFLPFHEIRIAWHSIDQTSLSESSFGAERPSS